MPEAPHPIDSEHLFRLYAGFVASFLHRLGARADAVDDLVQDVFLAAHRRGGYRPGAASPATFLARLSLEVHLGAQRREARRRRARLDEAALEALGSAPMDPAEALVARRAARHLRAALDAMDPGRRAVFVLFELHGESCESIAAGLQLKLGTVHSRLHAARKAFRKVLAASEAETEEEEVEAPMMGAKELV